MRCSVRGHLLIPAATHQGPALTDIYINNDFCAVDTGPSGTGQTTALGGANGAEYMTIKGIHASYCYYGCVADSGNVAWIGAQENQDYCPLWINNNASNGSHGSFLDGLANHCTYSVIAGGGGTGSVASYGYTVGHCFFLGSGSENMTIASLAITFDHCEFGGPPFITVSSAATNETITFDSNTWYGALPVIVNSTASPATVIWTGANVVTNASGNLTSYVTNLSPLQTDSGVSETQNYTLGSALTVTNPNFATTGGWTSYASGWTMAGTGYATSSGGSGVIYQALTGVVTNTLYQVTFTISSYVSGSVNVDVGGAYSIGGGLYNGRTAPRSANGTYTEYTQADSYPNIVIYSHAFSGSITGITVTPVTAILPGTMNVGALSQTAVQTTVSGSTSGSAVFSEPFIGSTYKKVVIHLAALTGTASYTYPTAFTYTPIVLNSDAVATSVSASAVTVTGSATTDTLILEGY